MPRLSSNGSEEQHAAKRIEFWNHGWDHAAGEKLIREFSGQPYEHQKDPPYPGQRDRPRKLGFSFESFGAPFNATDAVTARVLAEDPDIKGLDLRTTPKTLRARPFFPKQRGHHRDSGEAGL